MNHNTEYTAKLAATSDVGAQPDVIYASVHEVYDPDKSAELKSH